jgi:nitrogen fixation/metabolism regulation signal transduction histidine kinase
LKTRSENSGANGASTCIIDVGRVCIDHLSLSGLVTSVPYLFRSQMAKVQQRVYSLNGEARDTLSLQEIFCMVSNRLWLIVIVVTVCVGMAVAYSLA